MSSKKNIAKQIKKQILNNDFDYDYLYDELVDNSEDVLSGILNAYLYLFRNVDNICNEECLNNLNDLLYHYVRKNKNKKCNRNNRNGRPTNSCNQTQKRFINGSWI